MAKSDLPINGQNSMASDKNAECLVKFYGAFQKLDYKTMNQCYHTEATFKDPAFGELNYKEVTSMWEMLLSHAKDFSLNVSKPHITSNEGSCEVVANYTFTKTGKKIVNPISSIFEFKNGKIFRQVDTFDLWSWAKQALGFPAIALGWTSTFKKKIREEARSNLKTWMTKNNR